MEARTGISRTRFIFGHARLVSTLVIIRTSAAPCALKKTHGTSRLVLESIHHDIVSS